MRRLPPVLVLTLAAACAPAFAAAERPDWQLELERIMADPDWIGPPVEQPFWALDSETIYYALKRNGSPVRDTWQVPAAGGTPQPVDDTALATLVAPEPVFDPAHRRALYLRNGDVFLQDLGSGVIRQLSATDGSEQRPHFSADGAVAYWQLGDDWYGSDLNSGLGLRLTELHADKDPLASPDKDGLRELQLRLFSTLRADKAEREALVQRERALRRADPTRPLPVYLGDKVSIADSRLSPDRRWLLVVTEAKGDDAGKVGKLMRYVTESGYEETEDVRTRVGRDLPKAQQLQLVDLADGSVHPVALDPLPGIDVDPLAELKQKNGVDPLKGPRGLRIDGIEFNSSGSRAALLLRAIDNKDRWIATVDFQQARLEPRHRLTDPAWINWSFNQFGFVPQHDELLWLTSEESGYSQLVTLDLARGGKARALTSGQWEVDQVQWAFDGSRAYFTCNRSWPGDYEICSVERRGGEVRELTALDGVESFVLSPDGQQIAVSVSHPHVPMQLAVVPSAGGDARALTDTRSAAYQARQWLEPRFVQVPSKHGAAPIWGKLYRPETLEPGHRYPIVMFVHGAGYTQNAHARFPYYFREQMFHQLLVEHGYLVLDLDYRGSAGYGRDWRDAIYRQMGHPELEDYLDGIDWLAETQQGDADRVGIYGGSYGGFMTFMAMFRAPDRFKAGAALRPVADWTQYNHEYSSNILNTPDVDPEAYRLSSPIEYADGLQGELLICHGMIDDNVLFQDSVRMAQRLIELHKDGWTLQGYPLDRHGFVHADSWYDEYRRVFELFERNLKK